MPYLECGSMKIISIDVKISKKFDNTCKNGLLLITLKTQSRFTRLYWQNILLGHQSLTCRKITFKTKGFIRNAFTFRNLDLLKHNELQHSISKSYIRYLLHQLSFIIKNKYLSLLFVTLFVMW